MSKLLYNQVRAKADEMDKTLLSTDKRLRGAVLVVHQDGSSLFFNNAFAVRCDPEWIIVLTEHHGAHVYNGEDLLKLRTFSMGPAIRKVKL